MKIHPSLFSPDEMANRLAKVRARLAELGYGALVSTDPANVRYLTGFKGEPRTLLVTPDHFLLVTALRTLPWAQEQTAPLSNTLDLVHSDDPATEVVRRLGDPNTKVALDPSASQAAVSKWQELLSRPEVEPASVTESVRQIKSPAEVDLLRKSQEINEAILAAVLPQIRPHMTERGVQGLILAEMARREEVDAFSFPPIVAAGGNCWEIHHLPDNTVIGRDQMLLLDLGIIHQGYASDMTRTVCLGKSSEAMRNVHGIVREALESAITAAVAGATNREVDRVARDLIEQAGFGHTFTHGLGHQIGMVAHDPGPPLSQKAPVTTLKPGMAFTIEPGIYLQDQFGVRTEDVIIVGPEQPQNLTRPQHHLLELPL